MFHSTLTVAALVSQPRFKPGCRFPRNFTGTWYEGGDLDTDVTINDTHIYLKTKIMQYNIRERYFTCLSNKDTRYLLSEVIVGKWSVNVLVCGFCLRTRCGNDVINIF